LRNHAKCQGTGIAWWAAVAALVCIALCGTMGLGGSYGNAAHGARSGEAGGANQQPGGNGPGRSAAQGLANGAKATLRDLEWFTGRWVGESDGHPTEEVCSRAGARLMVCMFREVDDPAQTIEAITLREVDGGIEERVRHFSPALDSWDGAEPLVLRLQSITATELVFVNVKPNAVAKRVVVTRSGADAMISRVEVVTPDGKAASLEAKSARARD
jgi:hypothetical protein